MRILIGVWLLQALTAGPLWLVLTGQDPALIALGVATALGAGLIAALWIGTLLRDQRRLTEARQSERLAAAKARFQERLAKHKSEDAARLSALTQKMGSSRTRLLKVGLIAGGTLGLGVALFFAQVFTAGLLVAAFAGGGAAGYGIRGYLSRAPGSRCADGPMIIDDRDAKSVCAGRPRLLRTARS
ncbi:hypothetical protein SAMN05444722_0007 [Rhodovulum sp. ES.010]|uniref:hypothetical protein n=1 Tax=Rhodovulum sp. ES.010 TaxID=1882821 RepID=UPI000928C88A|nr:hypothetical protein [Rhodovulum sp. ES.010]SIN98537.1 hypothetical protein SAMN05444722_0007 [Rhodovulum sp. ES.010]